MQRDVDDEDLGMLFSRSEKDKGRKEKKRKEKKRKRKKTEHKSVI
jgi:hypothetical protein